VRHLPCPEIDATRAADGDGAVVLIEHAALIDEVLLHIGHIIKRVHVDILVIGKHEDEIWARKYGVN
jgi:hypothetical protein